MSSLSSEDRLARIENKIDQLSEAFIIMARTEEKLATIERDRQEVNDRLARIENKQEEIDKKLTENGSTINIINKLFWLVVASVVGAIVINYFN